MMSSRTLATKWASLRSDMASSAFLCVSVKERGEGRKRGEVKERRREGEGGEEKEK